MYDARDKLVEVQAAADLTAPATSILGRFQYDFEGRRIKKIGEEGLRQYVYDQTSLLAEYDSAGLQKAKYDYGSDRLISLTRTDEGRRYFSLDGLRSVVNLTDDSGSTVASYHLDAWGSFRFPSELTASRSRFAFTGHIYDDETGLYNAKARYFDPKLGRFLTQDSYLGQIDEPPSLHRYLYAGDRPTFFVDPTGHGNEEIVGTPPTPEQVRTFVKNLDQPPVPEPETTHGGKDAPKPKVAQEGEHKTELVDVRYRFPNQSKVGFEELLEEGAQNPGAVFDQSSAAGRVAALGQKRAAGYKGPYEGSGGYTDEFGFKHRTFCLSCHADNDVARLRRGAADVATENAKFTANLALTLAPTISLGLKLGGAAGATTAAEQTAARQTMATGKEWYDYFAGRYGSSNVEWVGGSGRTIQWPSQLPTPPVTEMLRVRPPVRSGTFVPDLASVAGSRPAGGVAHHVQPLFMGGVDSGTQNAAWAAETAHQSGHAILNPQVVPLPYGPWIVVKP